MPNTYTQLYVQIVFAVKYREALILPTWEDRVYRYITGIVQQRNHKMMAINGVPDHIHFLVSMHPADAVADMVREVKKASTDFIKTNRFIPFRFQWQSGYGAFSYNKSEAPRVVSYILNQKEHHRHITFRKEYLDLLKRFDIDFQEPYLFEFFD